ncbi:hypothetical protein FXO37_06119 [Capsicum annuum]|nr:hypothetical protein FXO37_06119 [Capsicum annuum]
MILRSIGSTGPSIAASLPLAPGLVSLRSISSSSSSSRGRRLVVEGDSRLESRNHSHSMGFEMPRLEDLWDMEQYFKAVRSLFDDQGTMATIYLSGDAKNI